MASEQIDVRTYTVPGRVVGWADDGGARVVVLSDAPGLPLREYLVRVQKPIMGRKIPNFEGLKKKGLRTKGMVLLRKAVLSGDVLEAKEVEILTPKDAEDNAFIFQEAACSIFPPSEGSQIATRARVAILSDAIVTETFTTGLAHVQTKLDQAGLFGHVGVIFAGRMKDGAYRELRFGGDEERTPKEIVKMLFANCPKDVIKESRTSGNKRERWVMVPFFEAEIAQTRASKLSAQRQNLDYGTPDAPKWTSGHAIMRIEQGEWKIADTTPAGDTKPSDLHSLVASD
ncbi:hypothetical protein [Roseibium sp. RKSG952]|uniref:hypothetical protein n=1 Tax=Roseibium sp. RKSG952 TaxID=2529384 RepID=UPI0012BC6976|nr:hypothetical protein [Roseibium sp. RKSG952]MTH96691.1 hypothetical protein [Roseibium sp. RKSG952]